jgi:DNA-binding NtrC family response regulator
MIMSDGRVLVVEDDAGLGMVLVGQLKQGGIRATHVSSGIEALEAFDADGYDVVITDYQMPGMNGLELLARLKERVAELPVIMITAHGDVSLAVNALKAGAAEFFEKPFDREAVLFTVKKALETSDKLASQPPKARIGADLLGDALAMNECRETIEAAARTMAHVLIRGESGSGKEVAARAIHNEGLRKAGAFIAVNCAALPDQLLESELFGYEKGAFTGAASRKPGRVELAQGGTLFLDEIGDVSPAVQAKLLRLLQEKQFEPLGSTRTHDADVRFIAATHRNLEEMVQDQTFRQNQN